MLLLLFIMIALGEFLLLYDNYLINNYEAEFRVHNAVSYEGFIPSCHRLDLWTFIGTY